MALLTLTALLVRTGKTNAAVADAAGAAATADATGCLPAVTSTAAAVTAAAWNFQPSFYALELRLG